MTRTMKTGIKAALLAMAASAALVACGGGGDSGVAPPPASGTLRVALTDAPNCRVGNDDLEKVFVTVERVRVHQSADAEPSNGGWTDIAMSPAKKINLLDLTNGRLEELGTAHGRQVAIDRISGGGSLGGSVDFFRRGLDEGVWQRFTAAGVEAFVLHGARGAALTADVIVASQTQHGVLLSGGTATPPRDNE